MKKLTGKRGKIYRGLLKRGKSEPYARRISKGLSERKSLKVARGFHKAERYAGLKKAYQPAPKSRIEKKKEAWAAYTFQDMLAITDEMISPFSVSSYDHTKTQFKNYDADALFAMHQYFERTVAHYLKWYYMPSNKNDVYVDFQEDARYKHRQFEWKLFDEDGELRYWLVYEKGQIIKRQMWEGFDFMQFHLEIREQKVWE